MDVRCHFCDEPHFIDDAEVQTEAFHFRCGSCETLHLVQDGEVRRVTLPEVRTSMRPPPLVDDRDTLPDITMDAMDTFVPVEGDRPVEDVEDRAPTLRMAPVAHARRLFGRETLAGATMLLLGLGMVGYAAAGPPPRPARALASGASYRAIEIPAVEASPTAAPRATSAPKATASAEAVSRAPAKRVSPRKTPRPR